MRHFRCLLIISDCIRFVCPHLAGSTVKSSIYPGNSAGGMQLNYQTSQLNREMYVGLMWRTNPQFQGRPVGNKTFFIRGPGSNGVFLFNNAALNNGSGSMIFAHNTGGLDNSHACALDSGLACYPNVGPGILTVGTWTKLEAYIKSSTTCDLTGWHCPLVGKWRACWQLHQS
jgi:hypothetical protein